MGVLRSLVSGRTVRFGVRLTVGRDEDNDLCLPEQTVSGRHALLEWRGTGYAVKDLSSTNGTSANGKRVEAWTRVTANTVICFGRRERWVVESAVVEEEKADQWRAVVAQPTTPVQVDFPHRLELNAQEGSITVDTGQRKVSFYRQPTRAMLLYALGEIRMDSSREGWISDDDLALRLWGREGRKRSRSRLNKLIHDTRKMFHQAGFTERLIEKRPGLLRIVLPSSRLLLIASSSRKP